MFSDAEFDKKMTMRALELAALGTGRVSPGPLVGCVIVDKAGEVVGEGTYFFENTVHAEAVALSMAGGKARGCTAYISLEPHSHHGRTPPCTEALIEAGIVRVVAPIEDPNPLVSGKGFEALKRNGIEVSIGVMRAEAEKQNEKFIHWHSKKRPFVHLKTASSLDGRISSGAGESQWITTKHSRAKGQKLRHEYDAILIGSETVLADNPNLTDRTGLNRRKQLIRVVLDSRLRVDPNCRLAVTAKDVPTLVITSSGADPMKADRLRELGVDVSELPKGGHELGAVLTELAARDIQSVLVEGGAAVAGSFFDQHFVDKYTCFLAPIVIGGKDASPAVAGVGARLLDEAVRLRGCEVETETGDFEITSYPEYGSNGEISSG